MKFRRRRSPLLFLLLTILLPADARSTAGEEISASSPLFGPDSSLANPLLEAAAVPEPKANPVGTKDAPVDGKDGKPHDGPFVETGAQRDRKKSKEAADAVPATKLSAKGQLRGSEMPLSNDGVMDDPDRLGPKDGTRGIEGGVTEKSKDTKVVDKVPGPPKEAPQLPHSEQEHIKAQEGKDIGTVEEDEKKLLEVLPHLTESFGSLKSLTEASWAPRQAPQFASARQSLVSKGFSHNAWRGTTGLQIHQSLFLCVRRT